MVSTCVDVISYCWTYFVPPHPVSTRYSVCVHLETGIKNVTQPKPHHLQVPLLQQRNNRLIQRLQIWPRGLNHAHMGGDAEFEPLSRHRSTAPCTCFDKLKQTEGHRAGPDTKHPCKKHRCFACCRRTPNPNNPACTFPEERDAKKRSPVSRSLRLKEKMTPSLCHFG